MNNNKTRLKKAEERFLTLRLCQKGFLNQGQAAKELNLSQRQVRRLLKKARRTNWKLTSFLPQERGGSNKKIRARKRILALAEAKPQRTNLAIQDLLLKEGIKVGSSTVRRTRIEKGLIGPRRKPRRTFKRFEAQRFGDLIQLDTMGRVYPFQEPAKLICLLDDHSRVVVSFKWVRRDTTWNNMIVLREMIENYGLPGLIYTDNDSKFKYKRTESRHQSYSQEEYETEVRRALRELNIPLLCHPPYQPFCKGKIERFFRFVQTRFLPESEAKNFKELNKEFKEWIKEYHQNHVNRMIKVKPKERLKPNGFKPLSKKKDLDFIFSIRKKRKIDKYNSFSFNGTKYFLSCKQSLFGERVDLALNPTHRIRVYQNKNLIEEFEIKKKKGKIIKN